MTAYVHDLLEVRVGVNAVGLHGDAGDDPARGRERVRSAEGLALQVGDGLDTGVSLRDDLTAIGGAAITHAHQTDIGALL